MKIKITRIVVSILFFITFCTPKGNAQPGIGLPYAFSTAASIIPATTNPSYTAAFASSDEVISNTIKPVVGVGPHATYPGFTYAGVLYPTFCISSNGFIVLSTSAAAGAAAPVGALPTNSLATYSGGVPLIAGLWDNLKGLAAYRWDTLNQTLWVRWSGVRWDTTTLQPATFAFAVSLNTVTNVIYIDHYTTTYTLIAAQSASIGIAGPCTGDYWSVQGGGAAADSTVDNMIGQANGATTVYSKGYNFTPKPPLYDACANAKLLASSPVAASASAYDTLSNIHGTSSGAMQCVGDVKDVWVKFIKPIGVSDFDVIALMSPACAALPGVSIEIDSGTCASLGTAILCTTTNTASVTAQDPCTAHTYYARITGDGDVAGKFRVAVQDPTAHGLVCANANTICSIPYNSSSLNTSGSGNDYTAANTPCASQYHNGNDYVFAYTPPSSECDSISITGTGVNSYPGIFVYDACPNVATNCIASASAVSNSASINRVTLQGGVTYYIVVDNNSTSAGTPNIPFVLHVYNSGVAVPLNDDCAALGAAFNFGNISAGATCGANTKTGSNECSTTSLGGTNPGCGNFVSGVSGDVWYQFTSQITGSVQVNLTQGASNAIQSAGMAIYTSCAGAPVYCTGAATALSISVAATTGTTYYIRIWSPNAGQAGSFNLCVFDPSGATCAAPVTIPSIPYTSPALNTSGYGNEYTPANTPCASSYHNGQDFVFKYTTGASPICVQISATGTGVNSYPGVFVYDLCPDAVGAHCVGSATGTSNSATITKISLNASTTYYIVVDNDSIQAASHSNSIPFTLSISANGSAPANDNYCNGAAIGAVSLGTLNASDFCSAHTNSTGTTECASNTAANLTPACAGYVGGVTGDVWFRFTAGTATSAAVLLTPSGATPIQNAGMAVYVNSGSCPSTLASQVACAGPSSSISINSISLVAGFTYLIRIWSPSPAQAGTFTLCVSDNCSANDEPCGAIVLPTPTTTCTPQTFTTACATQSSGPPAPTCVTSTLKNDVWMQVTIPSSGSYVFQTGSNGGMTDPVMQLYTSPTNSCTNLATLSCNDDGFQAPCNLCPYITVSLTAGQIVWIRIWPWNSTYGTFTLCVYAVCQTGVPPPAGDDPCTVPVMFPVVSSCSSFTTFDTRCASPTVPTLPLTSCTNPNTVGRNDDWIRIIVPPSGQLEFNTQAGTVTDWVMAVYNTNHNGCGGITEIACNDDGGINPCFLCPYLSLNSLVPGDTLYVRMYPYGTGAGTYGLCINDPCPTGVPPTNDNPCGAIAVTADTICTYSGPYSNLCSSTTSGVPAPGCAGSVFHDVWFKIRIPASGHLDIDSKSGTLLDGGMAAYESATPPTACNSAFVLKGCDDNNSSNPNMPHLSITGTPGDTVYVRFWDNGGHGGGTFYLCATDPCPSGTQANDQPCSAIPMNINVYYPGNNSCTDNTLEPIAYPANAFTPSCWTNSSTLQLNTVWYSFVAPSASVTIKTVTGSLSNTQIALYTGDCHAPSLVSGTNCNDNFANCGGTPLSSQLTATVTPGTTYFVVVDGYQGLSGSFSIIVLDATQPIPPQTVQDCALPASICSQVTTVADPGYLGYGNICDLQNSPNYGCFPYSSETNSSFYTFNINANGGLLFDITPTSNSTNYDWVLWRIGTAAFPVTTMAPVCSLLTAHATGGGGLPVVAVCNVSNTTGITGIRSTGLGTSQAAAGVPFCAQFPVVTGETYLLMINNTSGTNVGYSLDFTPASPIAYATPTNVQWSSPTTSLWSNTANWGACGVTPACNISAYINNHPNYPTSTWSQPQITSTANVNDLLINLNGKLQIGADTLYVCGNFTQNGSLVATANSVVCFIGTGTQYVSGNLTGSNAFANVVINKTSGVVVLNNNIDVKGKFTILNNTSVFNINGHYMKVAKDFANANGKNTFIGRRFSTVEFNGTANQNFTNGSDTTYFDQVLMNMTAGRSLNLTGANSSMYVDSLLTLTSGKIVTTSNTNLEVVLSFNNGYTVPTATYNPAISGYNTNSYVNGKLRRRVYRGSFSVISPLLLDFPVGDASNYQLASLNLQQATTTPYIQSYFTTWPTLPSPFGPTAAGECFFAVYDTSELLNNGYWSFVRTSPITGAQSLISLHNTSVSNSGGYSAFTVTYSDSTLDPYLSSSWHLNGKCVYASTVPNVQRDTMTLFSLPSNFRLASTQGASPFPITLLFFNAKPEKEGVRCTWETASEINNDHFVVERSHDAKDFIPIGTVKGFGAGTSTQPLNYSLFDKEPPCVEVLYYRLRQVDIDGHYSFSPTVAVHCNNKDMISLYPNPANTEVNVNFYQDTRGTVTVRIVDIVGKTVSETDYEMNNGYNVVNLKITDLPQGVYYVKLITDRDENSSSSKLAKFLKY